MKNKTEQILERELRILKRKLTLKEKENETVTRELNRIKKGIKTVDVNMNVDGNDMNVWGWATQDEVRAVKRYNVPNN